ncbi:MAG TPA: Maf family protein [Steroidobacteraceae bacterium]|nr:Maf family protein [Steroidobacteraceae bacterium]
MRTVSEPVLCLASVSPRRQELLSQIGVPHTVTGAHIDETVRPEEGAREYVIRMAREKALAVRGKGERLPVLAADTTVVLDEVIFGKPTGRADGLAMLGRLSGRTHSVLTAVALSAGQELSVSVSASEVRFRPLSAEECAAYWETGEPHDKAGSYAIQGRGAVFIEWLSGSYSGVMGLPLYETAELLRAAGVPCWYGASR